jgi:hypothetical protein
MPLSPADYVVWAAGTVLRLVLCTLILRHRAYRQIPFFSAFVFLATVRTLALWWIYHDPDIEAGIVFNVYWATQMLQVASRGLAAGEICWLVLRAYPGIWALTWRLLAGVGGALVVFALLGALEETRWVPPVVLRAERGLELAVIGLLVALFAVTRYYGIRVAPVVKYLALGLGVHAVIQSLNNSLFQMSANFEAWWGGIRVMSLNLALFVWILGLRQPIALPARPTAQLYSEPYEQWAPQVSHRLRELNERLLGMLR